jgi:hypothetical protein
MLSGTMPIPRPDIQHVYAPTQMNVHYNYLPPTNPPFPSYVASNPALLAFPGYTYPVGLTPLLAPIQNPGVAEPLPTYPNTDASYEYTEACHPKRSSRKQSPETRELKNKMHQNQLEWEKKAKPKKRRNADTRHIEKPEVLTSVKLNEPPTLATPIAPTLPLTETLQTIEQMKLAIERLNDEKKELQKDISRLYREMEHWKSKYYLLEGQAQSSVSEVFGPQLTLTYEQNRASQDQVSLQEMLKAFEFKTPPGSTTSSPMKPKNRS